MKYKLIDQKCGFLAVGALYASGSKLLQSGQNKYVSSRKQT